MDLMTVGIIFVAGLITFGVVIFMLNRAWGDFPRRAGPLDHDLAQLTGSRRPAWGAAPADDDDDDDDLDAALAGDALPAGAPEGGLVPITNPQVRMAVERALERGGTPYATYFLRDGDRYYLAAHRIADPVERARIVRLFQGLNGGDLTGVNFGELISVIQRLGK
jgi:hypothetical protein